MIDKKINKSEAGYSLLELLLAVFIGSFVLAGGYASYSVIADQYQKNSGIAEIRDFAIPTIKILTRDLRMAGFRAVDNNIESTYAKIDPPITITNVSGACCDSFTIIYDKAVDNRIRVTYFVQSRTNPARSALYMNVDKWDGNAWVSQTATAIVADYVEDFQVTGSQNNASGYPTLVSFDIVFRSRNKTPYTNVFTKSAYANGDNTYSTTDNYLREQFDSTVYLRNLAH